ncbi:MAG: 2,3-bisphosphoglycerate-independent phosphoglycerate mutase [Desulfobacteraceae bacterium]|nr:MAG: 2,3-bisphosphoglycerate-independent phosphoglycerate mutase [Desulfobacteraceae bacterium]
MKKVKPCILIILDGWGLNPSREGNAVAQAKLPYLTKLMETYPHTHLICSGEAVGLPDGIMGNSEVGHLNIGAGRIVYQDLLRIDKAIQDKSFFKNKMLTNAFSIAKEKKSNLHIMGLVSDGGVHSQLTHLFALLEFAKQKKFSNVYIHAILDGRDTPPDSGAGYITKLQNIIQKLEIGCISSICGRFFAMDRDTRWDRTKKAYQLYTQAQGIKETDPITAVRNAYARGETDEFVQPIVLNPEGTISDHDCVIFFNFRADRARQITRALTDLKFAGFKREVCPRIANFVCLTMYDESFTLPIAFPPQHLDGLLGEVLSKEGLSQLRIAETEKYAHVTYFFNGGEEKPFPGEDRCLIPSPRDVETYDQKPEMSALPVGDEVVSRIQSGRYDLIVLNFANMDMVGHTGIIPAAIKACEAVDENVQKVVTAIQAAGGTALITADHGNAEKMLDDHGQPHTAHTVNPVPFIIVNEDRKNINLRPGILGDIAPTILDIMGIAKPRQMTGRSLIQ